MDDTRKHAILAAVKQQLEDSAEAATIELRICTAAKDERGADAARKRAVEMETKIKAAAEIEAELTAKKD